MAPIRVEFACCFCYEAGEAQGEEPIALTVSAANETGSQTFYAHLECLRRAFHPKVRLEVPFPWEGAEEQWEIEGPPIAKMAPLSECAPGARLLRDARRGLRDHPLPPA